MEREKLIQKYLRGTITDEELQSFIVLEKQDSNFLHDLELESLLYKKRNKEFRDELELLKDEASDANHLQNPKSPAVLRKLRPLLIAAAILIPLLIIGYQFINTSNTNLIDQYLTESIEAPPILMNDTNIPEDHWSQAMAKYREQRFTEASDLINLIEARTEEQELYLGLSYLFQEKPDYDQSLKSLSVSLNNPKAKYRDIALWYAGLIIEKQEPMGAKNPFLKEIIETESWNYKKAEELF